MTDWLARAIREGTPLIDGTAVTFVWVGEHAPTLRSDLTGWWPGAQPWRLEAASPGVWTFTTSLPATAYLEYAYFDGETRRPDPFNPHLTPTGYGSFNNYVYMPAAPRPAWETGHADLSVGRVVEVELTARMLTDGRRTVRLYQPPAPGPYPLLVVFDGCEYAERARLPTILDNLLHAGHIPPLAAALVDNHPQARIPEYACSEATLTFLVNDLLPWVGHHLFLDPQPGAHGVVGSSMGGLMATYVGLRRPDVFGHILSQSGAFGFRDESLVFSLARWQPRLPVRLYQSVGTFEMLLGINRRFRETLVASGYDAAYHEFDAGHNYPAWAADLTRGLTWLYPR